MAYKSGTAFIEVTPSLAGWQESIRRQLREELRNAGFDVPVEPKTDPSQGPKDGEQYGDAFGDAARRRIDAALKDLPNPKIDADSSEADRKIDEIRARLEELRDKRINLELSDTEFLAEMARIKAELDELALKSPEISVRVNAGAASAELDAFAAEVDRLDGRTINIDTSRGVGGLNLLLTTGLALGPALIPVAATIAAAFGAIGPAAILGVGGLGTIGLAFSGVSDAVKELGKAHTATGKTAAQSAAQQLSAANSVLSAQESVRSAQIGLANAEDSLARSREQAAVAEQNASAQVDAAVRRERDAELSLIDAQRSALQAQQALTQARQDAQRALEDQAFAVQDNALAQRRARIDLDAAKDALVKASAGGTGVDTAQLGADEAQQRLTELEAQGKRLAADKQAADKAGVDGSRQVTAAQDALVAANQRVTQAQEQARLSAAAVTKAQVDGSRQVDQANQSVIQAERGVEQANQAVGAAIRSVAQAQAQQGAQAAATAPKVDKLAESMGKLSPEGQHFAHFVHDDLQPKLKELQATAQAGLLPGVEQGIKNAMPQFGLLNDTVGIIAHSFGDLATRAGTALTDPFWTGFFTFIKDEAGPSIHTFGDIIGNLATGAAGLIQAFKPVWDEMGAGLENLTGKFAHFGQDAAAGKSDSFNHFLDYVKQAAPEVKELLHQLADLVGNLAQAFAGQGLGTLSVLNETLRLINSLPPPVLRDLIDLFIAYKLLKLGVGIYRELKDVILLLIGEDGVLGALKKIKASGGLRGALAGGAGKALGAAGVIGGIGLADDLTGGGVGNTINTLAGAPKREPGLTFSGEIGKLFGGDFSMGSGPADPNDADDMRNWPRMVVNAFKDAKKELPGVWSGIVGDATTWFGRLKTSVTTETQSATGNLRAAWDSAPGWLGGKWDAIWADARAKWSGITGTIGGQAQSARDTAMGWMNDLGRFLSHKWDEFWGTANAKWSNFWGMVTGFAGRVRDDVSGDISRLGDNVAGSFQWCIDRVRGIWNQLGDIAKRPVNFVIDPVYNRGIVPVWNKIAGVFGMGQLGPAALLAEGGVLPGYAPGRDSIPAVLSPGEGVLVPEAVRGLGPQFVRDANRHFSGGRAKSDGGPGFAGGGIVGAIESGWDWATGLFTDPLGAVRRLFSPVTSLAIPGVGGLHDALSRLPGKVVDAVVAAAKKLATTVGALGPIGAGGPFYVGQISQASRVRGLGAPGATIGTATALVETGLRNLANPAVPASLAFPHDGLGHDHDSIGLFQQRQAGWGTVAQRMNPFASAGMFFDRLKAFNWRAMDPGAAAQRVQVSAFPGRYSGQMGRASGLVAQYGGTFDQGGWLPPGLTLAYNGTGQRERVVTGKQWQAAVKATRTGASVTNNWHVYEANDANGTALKIQRRQEMAARTGPPL